MMRAAEVVVKRLLRARGVLVRRGLRLMSQVWRSELVESMSGPLSSSLRFVEREAAGECDVHR